MKGLWMSIKNFVYLHLGASFGFLILCLIALGCAEKPVEESKQTHPAMQSGERRKGFPVAIKKGKIFEKGGIRYLWGGWDESQHFVINELRLKPEQFHFGIGRERFPALIEPEFVMAEEANIWLADTARVLGLKVGDEVKAYPLVVLSHHEVVNDVIGRKPIFTVYCNFANLAAIYDRQIDRLTHTFAQSGYTYYDPEVWDGMDGFVLWDRETESLWWPLIGKAVSGPLIDTPMKVYDKDKWSQTTWGEWKALYRNTVVLDRGQDLERPKAWPKYDVEAIHTEREKALADDAIAPRWGENASLGAQMERREGTGDSNKRLSGVEPHIK